MSYDARRWRRFLDAYFQFVDAAWRRVDAAGPPTPAAAAAAASGLIADATAAMRALPEPPRRNALVASVARRIKADVEGYLAVIAVAVVAWAHPVEAAAAA